MERSKRILVTSIGVLAASAVISELRENIKDVYIFGADINEKNNVVASKDVDEFYVFPMIVQDELRYYDFLKDFCVKHNIGYVFCFIDEEVNLLSEKRDDLINNGIYPCIPNELAIKNCHFKNRFCEWIERNIPDIAIKRYSSLDEISEYPVFAKPIIGRASIGCTELKSQDEARSFFRENNNKFKDFIVQEKVEGTVYAVDVVRSALTNQYYDCQRIELLRNSSGCGIAVQIVNDKKLSHICEEVAAKLDLNGLVNMEFFKVDGKFYIIEINPRCPAGTSYSSMAGADTVMNALRIASGEAIVLPRIDYDKHFCRRYETYEM